MKSQEDIWKMSNEELIKFLIDNSHLRYRVDNKEELNILLNSVRTRFPGLAIDFDEKDEYYPMIFYFYKDRASRDMDYYVGNTLDSSISYFEATAKYPYGYKYKEDSRYVFLKEFKKEDIKACCIKSFITPNEENLNKDFTVEEYKNNLLKDL